MEQLTKNQAVATSQEAVQNQNEPQLRDENAHNDKSVHGVLNPTYQAGLRRDAVQPDIEAERKNRDEIDSFQAEDGIRDVAVTGVQTCALPISLPTPSGKRMPRAGNYARNGTKDPRRNKAAKAFRSAPTNSRSSRPRSLCARTVTRMPRCNPLRKSWKPPTLILSSRTHRWSRRIAWRIITTANSNSGRLARLPNLAACNALKFSAFRTTTLSCT